jgi:transposase InsO family protein
MQAQREQIVALALCEGANRAELARRAKVSRKTLYKWMDRQRQAQAGPKDLSWAGDRPRRPKCSPRRTSCETEQQVLGVRAQNPAWGGRKIRRLLLDQAPGEPLVPAASTITMILKRHGKIEREQSLKRMEFTRFEHEHPNDLWQMDFKGPVCTERGGWCRPLTVIDDHSRYALCVKACANERGQTVQKALTAVLRLYGLPRRILVDNGSCWRAVESPWTPFTLWLMRLGIRVTHSRPRHPQTHGKNERFNRTLKAEAMEGVSFTDLAHCQRRFDEFTIRYNTVRPHESLQMQPPITRYRPSPRPYPERLPPVEYMEGEKVRKVSGGGFLKVGGSGYHVGHAFAGEPVALRQSSDEHQIEIWYSSTLVSTIDLKEKTSRTHW